MNVQLLLPPQTESSAIWLANIGQVKLGVDFQNGWRLFAGGHTTGIVNPADTMPLLPLLETGRGRFYQHLQDVAQVQSSIASILLSFPEGLLVRFALESSVSDYWPLKALDWLDVQPTLYVEVSGSLTSLLDCAWATQRLRQRVVATVRRAGKSEAEFQQVSNKSQP